jgi:hypothetical protein
MGKKHGAIEYGDDGRMLLYAGTQNMFISIHVRHK